MITDSPNPLLEIINQQHELQLALKEYLSKATSLLQVSLDQDFLTHPPTTIYGYLWALDDFVEKSKDLNEQALKLFDPLSLTSDISAQGDEMKSF